MRYDDAKTTDVPESIRTIIRENTVEYKEDSEDYRECEEQKRVPKYLTKGLVLGGIVGSGKTHCLHAIKNTLRAYGPEDDTSEVSNWVEILFDMKEKMNSGRGLRSVIERITDAKYCFIDDLGAENDTKWGQEMLYLVVNQIYNQEGVLFVSSNLTLEKMIEQYGQRIMSRIGHMCEFIDMPEKDYR